MPIRYLNKAIISIFSINLIIFSLIAVPIQITNSPSDDFVFSPSNDSFENDAQAAPNSLNSPNSPNSHNSLNSPNSRNSRAESDPKLQEVGAGLWTNTWNFTNTSAYTLNNLDMNNGDVELTKYNNTVNFGGWTDFKAGLFDKTELDSLNRLKLTQEIEPRYIITDPGNHRIVEVTDEKEWRWQYGVNGTPGGNPGFINGSQSMFILPSGNFVVTDTNNHHVIEINHSIGDKIEWSFGVNGTAGSGPNDLDTPTHASLLPNGDLLVTDSNNHQVVEIDKLLVKKGWTYGTGNPGSGQNKLDTPSSAFRLPNGTTLIADRGNDRVFLSTSSKSIVWQYGTPGSPGFGPNQLNSPSFAIPLENGNFLITDSGNHRIIELTLSGTIIWTYGITNVSGSAENYLKSPEKAYPIPDGNYLIADKGNHRVIEVSRTNQWVWQYGVNESAGVTADKLNSPTDLIHFDGGYYSSGDYYSSAINAGSEVFWKSFSESSIVPSECSLQFYFRIGSSSTPGDPTWTAWEGPYNNPSTFSFSTISKQFMQFRAVLNTLEKSKTGRLSSLSFSIEKYNTTGSIILSEFSHPKITQFIQFNPYVNLNGQTINYFYSLDSGNSWLEIPSNNSLKELDSSFGKIQFKAELFSSDPIKSPVLNQVQLEFTRIGELIEIKMDPAILNISAGNFYIFSAEGFDDLGNVVEIAPIWSTNVGMMNGFVFTAQTTVGLGYVNATVGSVVGSCIVNVTPSTLDHIKVEPFEVNMTAGSTHEFEAVGFDRYGNSVEFIAFWSSTPAAIGEMDGNLFRSHHMEGDGIIMARNGSIFGMALVHIKFDIQHPPPEIRGVVPNQIYPEDSPSWQLDLTTYEYDSEDSGVDLNWYVTGKYTDLVTISGDNHPDDIMIFTPKPDAAGSARITLWLEDSMEFSDYQDLWINLTPVNDKPWFKSLPDLWIKKGEEYNFNFEPYVRDIDNALTDLTVFLKSAKGADWAITMDGLKAQINYPGDYIENQDIITITVSDGNMFSSDVFLINFTKTSPPVINAEAVIPEKTSFPEDTNITLSENINEYFSKNSDSGELQYSFISKFISAKLENTRLNLTNKIKDWYGTDKLVIRASDVGGAFIETAVQVTVLPVNDRPVILDLPDVYIHYDEEFKFDLTPYISDVDNGTSELNIQSNAPDYINQKVKNPYMLIFNYSESAGPGYEYVVTYTVSDGLTKAVKAQLIIVTDNYPPRLNKPLRPVQLFEDESLFDHFNLKDHFIEPEGQALEFDVIAKTVIVEIKNNANVDFSAPLNWNGQETIIFTATDSDQFVYFAAVSVTVIPVNDKPLIDEIPHQVGAIESYWVLDLRPYITDPDNPFEELFISLDQTRGFATLNGNSIVFNYYEATTEALTVEVTDGSESSSTSFVIEFKGIVIEDETSTVPEDRSFEIYMAYYYILILIVTINSGGIAYFYMKYKGKFKLEDLFLIHANGNLIAHVGRSDRIYTDNEILSGMLTAIQDFIKDGFSEGSESTSDDWGLDHLKFGDRNIFIERDEYMYIAAVFKGEIGYKLRKELQDALKTIDSEYSKILKKWMGRLDGLEGINGILEKKFEQFAPKEEKKVYTRDKTLAEAALEIGESDDLGIDFYSDSSDEDEKAQTKKAKSKSEDQQKLSWSPVLIPPQKGTEDSPPKKILGKPSIERDDVVYHLGGKAKIPRPLTDYEKDKLPKTKSVKGEIDNIDNIKRRHE